MKICGKCKVEKSSEDFWKKKSRKDGLDAYCVECRKADRNPAWSQKHELNGFDLTLAQYQQMVSERNGLCDICKEPEQVVDVRTGKVRNLAVDHCHITSKVRGLLCYRCNRAIGLLQDDPKRLLSAAAYLTGSQE